MKDSNDKQTLDLIDKPRRGRPPTGTAKTQAQIQREYRQRVKQRTDSRPSAEQLAAGFFVFHLGRCCRVWRNWSGVFALSHDSAQTALRGLQLAADQAGTGDQFRVDPAPVSASEGVIYASS